MRFTLSLAIAALASVAFAADRLVVNTPAVARECEFLHITWEGGVAPFNLFKRFDGTFEQATGLTERFDDWNINLPAGTEITLQVTDQEGGLASSAPFVVQPGTDTSCL